MEQVTDTVIREILGNGGFRYVTELIFIRCGYMSMNTAWMLMHACPDLTEIGNINSWSAVVKEDVVIFLNFVRSNNISLSLSY
jgi:hypothetical protein